MGNIFEDIKNHFENTPKEELEKEFEDLKVYNQFGPSAEEFIKEMWRTHTEIRLTMLAEWELSRGGIEPSQIKTFKLFLTNYYSTGKSIELDFISPDNLNFFFITGPQGYGKNQILEVIFALMKKDAHLLKYYSDMASKITLVLNDQTVTWDADSGEITGDGKFPACIYYQPQWFEPESYLEITDEEKQQLMDICQEYLTVNSKGLIHLVGILSALKFATEHQTILLIPEVDTYLHIALQMEMTRNLFNKYNIFILMTTNSPMMVDHNWGSTVDIYEKIHPAKHENDEED